MDYKLSCWVLNRLIFLFSSCVFVSYMKNNIYFRDIYKWIFVTLIHIIFSDYICNENKGSKDGVLNILPLMSLINGSKFSNSNRVVVLFLTCGAVLRFRYIAVYFRFPCSRPVIFLVVCRAYVNLWWLGPF